MRDPAETLRFAAPDGVRIAAEVQGDGAPLVLLHGITEDRRSWDDLARPLARRFRVVRLDFRGHGESDRVDGVSALDLVEDVQAVVAGLELGAPALVGHSLGGVVATVFAATHPVSRVVNVDQTLRLSSFQAVVRPFESRLRGGGFREALLDVKRAVGFDLLPPGTRARCTALAAQADQRFVVGLWEQMFTMPPEEIDALLAPILPLVRVPYLALHGFEPDREYQAWLHERVPQATVEWWPGLGHWLHLVDADRFLARLCEFLS